MRQVSAPDDRPEMSVRPGDVLAGKYRVERVLGVGGMGVVVAAHHIQLDEKVALKFLLPHMLANAEAVGRFSREARAAVKIKSEHVARVFDVGTLETGAPYMVMEFLDGGDLSDWLQTRGALEVEQAVEFVLQACVAIAEAHALGIVHRDLKPANLFCVRRADGQLAIKVLDFGISKVTVAGVSAPEMSMTATTALMGSPLYMSPEQMESAKNVDARTDIWALGIILYELLAKHPPFEGDSMPAVCMKITAHPPPPLAMFRPSVPAGLEAVILRCLEKNRDQRYRNVAELALALFPFAPRRAKASVERISGIIQSAGLSATTLTPPSSPGVATQVSPVGTMAPFGVTTPSTGTRGKVAAVVIAGVITVAAGGLVLLLAVRHSSQTSGASPGAAIVAPAEALPPPSTQAAIASASAAPMDPPAPAANSAPPVVVAQASSAPLAKAPQTKAQPVAKSNVVAASPPSPSLPPSPASPRAAPTNASNADPLSALRPK